MADEDWIIGPPFDGPIVMIYDGLGRLIWESQPDTNG